jgi:hypothetical protein
MILDLYRRADGPEAALEILKQEMDQAFAPSR